MFLYPIKPNEEKVFMKRVFIVYAGDRNIQPQAGYCSVTAALL
jgi:hypothetical protein